MYSFEKKLKKETEKIRMRAPERAALRERVISFMEYHPMPEAAQPLKKIARRSAADGESFRYVRMTAWQWRSAVGVFAVLLMIGVPAAAERSVPGDVLYPVKLRVNEEVYSQLTLSPYERVQWETRRVERRIAEARLLAKEGKLTEEVEAQI